MELICKFIKKSENISIKLPRIVSYMKKRFSFLEKFFACASKKRQFPCGNVTCRMGTDSLVVISFAVVCVAHGAHNHHANYFFRAFCIISSITI